MSLSYSLLLLSLLFSCCPLRFLSNDSNNNAVVVAGFVGVLGGIRKMPAMSSAQKKKDNMECSLCIYFALISSLLSFRIKTIIAISFSFIN